MKKHEELGLKTIFDGRFKERKLRFINLTDERTSVSSVEIYRLDRNGVCDESSVLAIDPEDNIAMAVAVLGVGRVTDDIEAHAQMAAQTGDGATEEDLLKYAVINLRAAMIVRESNSEQAKKDLEDAYALYKLAYPNSGDMFEIFKEKEIHKFWVANLRKMRKDPSALGAL
jgi:hypothetical protein